VSTFGYGQMFACKTPFFYESVPNGRTAVGAESLPGRNFAATGLASQRQGRPAVSTKVLAVWDVGPAARAKHAVLLKEAVKPPQPAYPSKMILQTSKTNDISLLGAIEVVFVSADCDRAVHLEA
jgi:hypothetical protein